MRSKRCAVQNQGITLMNYGYLYIYNYFEKGCRKKCTRQSRKALWVVLSLLFLKRNLKELVGKAMEMCLRVLKESNKSRFDSYSRQKQYIDHIPYYLSGLSRARFSDNLSRNSCIYKCNICCMYVQVN